MTIQWLEMSPPEASTPHLPFGRTPDTTSPPKQRLKLIAKLAELHGQKRGENLGLHSRSVPALTVWVHSRSKRCSVSLQGGSP